MTSQDHRQLILEALRRSSRPLDDDELSAKTMIRPRQQVNQICRALERGGVIRRVPGPDRKLVNELVDPGSASLSAVVDAAAGAGRAGRVPADAAVARASGHSLP